LRSVEAESGVGVRRLDWSGRLRLGLGMDTHLLIEGGCRWRLRLLRSNLMVVRYIHKIHGGSSVAGLQLSDRLLLQLLLLSLLLLLLLLRWRWWRRRCKSGYGSGGLGLCGRLRDYGARKIWRDRRWFRVDSHITGRVFSVVAFIVIISGHFGFRRGSLLSSDFFCGEEAATRSAGATHGMFVA
jgi:hypothetical protein